MPAKKGSKRRTDWGALKKRFLKHDWETIDAMIEALNMPRSTVYHATNGWTAERDEMDTEIEPYAKEIIQQDLSAQLQRMLTRQIMIAEELQVKAANRLLGKVKDKRTGRMKDREFDDDGLSVAALRFSGGVLGQLMRNNRKEGDEGGLGGPIFDLGGSEETIRSTKDKIVQYSPDQLRLIIGGKVESNKGNKKARG